MTDSTFDDRAGWVPFARPRTAAAADATAPAPASRTRPPVFIGDAVTPLAGETLLSLMSRPVADD